MTRPFLTVVEPPVPPGGDLPRMDVAAFAGFAEAGPFGVPVCVESPDGFAAVFGRPVALPGGPGRLADAAGAFFAQGGRRAWVVRCGDAATAPASFPLPGVIAVLEGDPAPRTTGCAPRRSRPAAPGRSPTTSASRPRCGASGSSSSRHGSGVRIVAGDAVAGRLVELPLLRDGVAARRLAVLAEPEDGVFGLESAVTVAEAPALERRAGGPRRRAAGADGPRRRRPGPDRDRRHVPRPTAVGRLVRFDPDPVRPPLPKRALRDPEPPTWVLVDDVSAPPAGAGSADVVISGAAVNVDRDPSGELQPGPGARPHARADRPRARRRRRLAAERRRLRAAVARLAGRAARPTSSATPGPKASSSPATVPVSGAGLGSVVRARADHERSGLEAAPVAHARAATRNGITGTVLPRAAGPPRRARRRRASPAWLRWWPRATAEQPARLPGIVGMLDAPEATLLAVPDAVAGNPPAAPPPARRSRAAARAGARHRGRRVRDLRRAARHAGARRRRAPHGRRDPVVGRARRGRVRGRPLPRRRRHRTRPRPLPRTGRGDRQRDHRRRRPSPRCWA